MPRSRTVPRSPSASTTSRAPRRPARASSPGCAWTRSSTTPPAYVETLGTRRLAFQANGTNGADGWDILGIVVELDVATMLGRAPGTLFAVAAETVTAGKFPVRLDRFGRAFVKGQMLGELGADTVNRDLDLRELWNQEDPFELAPNYLGAYRARLNANLAVMDGIDGKIDWPCSRMGPTR